MKKSIFIIIILIFIAHQTYLSLSKKDFYPFNSYQMFSKNWHSGIVIAGIEAKIDSSELKPIFTNLNIPFFQANRIFLKSLYETKNAFAHKKLCEKLLDAHNSKKAELFGVMKKFNVPKSSGVSSLYNFNEKAIECTK